MKIIWTLIAGFFIIANLGAADYYWVGGSGNWSDITHWAATSGGSVNYPTAPTSEDNVIFDNNSFTGPDQSVTLTTDIIFFKDMDWTGVTNNPDFIGAESVTLNAFGNVILSPNMNYNFEGEFTLTGEEEDKIVDLAGHRIPGAIVFNGRSRWTLDSAILVDSMLHIKSGELNFNNQIVETRYFYITSTNEKRINFTNSDITISGAYRPEHNNDNGSRSFVVNLDNLELNSGNSSIDFTAENATFYHFGNGTLLLNNVMFSANNGRVLMSSTYFTNVVSFSNLTFMSSAEIEGIIAAETLNITGGNLYTFASGRAYNFGSIIGNANCSRGIVITSNSNNFNTDFIVTEGAIEVEYLTLRDVHASGGASFIANSGVDLGNNNGWTFTNDNPVSYYWVGGTGLWTDGAHWSFTSGGLPSGCIPSGKDDVFFDSNSFDGSGQTVTLNRRNLYVHDMTWEGVTGNPVLNGNADFTLNLTGSLEFDPNMIHEFVGNYDFESNDLGNTIRSNGIIFNQSIRFSGLNASWELLDDIEVLRFVEFESGELRTNGFMMTLIGFYSYSTLARNLDIRNSQILLRFQPYRNPAWEIDLNNYNLEAQNSTIEFVSEGGEMRHRGEHFGPAPEYNNIFFNTSTAFMRSRNNATGDDVPAISINNLEFAGRADIEGSNYFRRLVLADGFDYSFDASDLRRQVVDDLVTQGSCEYGHTRIYSNLPSSQANIDLNKDYDLQRLYVRDINFRGGSVTANNSIDGGNNNNIAFFTDVGRTLYWVGDGGLWQDPAHWSLASGGIGGECIPTPIDDVIFDENSFTIDDEVVYANPQQFSYCRNITWTNTLGMPRFQVGVLDIHGSIFYDQSFENDPYINILSSRLNETVISDGQRFRRILVRGEGRFSFDDDLIVDYFIQRAGNIVFDNINALIASIEFQEETLKTAELRNSQLTITGDGGTPFDDNSTSLTVDPGNSRITFTGFETGIYSRSNISLNEVRFSNTQGKGYIITRIPWEENDELSSVDIRSIVFNGNGEFMGNATADSLIGSPGKIYTFESEKVVVVSEYMQFIGNNCTPIEIRSSTNNGKATINMPVGSEVLVDFVQMRNNIGAGGAIFNAGSRSIDVGASNEGWTFEDAPDFIETGFLGNDGALCADEDIVLNAFSYSPGEQYLWSDGSIDSILNVSEAGTYFVEVQFESECILRDTIIIFSGEDVTADLPPEIGICDEEDILLNAGVPINIAEYSWNVGSTDSTLHVESAGSYIVEINVDGCLSYDTTEVFIVDDPGLDLGENQIICENTSYSLPSGLNADAYLWSDGSTDSLYLGDTAGVVWLEINTLGCFFRDSVLISTISPPQIELGRDTSLCEGQDLLVLVELEEGESVFWSTGTEENEITINEAGTYIAEKRNFACTAIDTINVEIISRPPFGLGEDQVSCEGSEVILSVPEVDMEFIWEDGSLDMDRIIQDPGVFTLTIKENGCSFSDSVNVSFLPAPVLSLGRDTLACNDAPLVIRPVVQSAGILSWEDGSIGSSLAVDSSGTYAAVLANGECVARDSINITFEDCAYFESFIPNVFSPNEDGVNDLFQYFFSDEILIESFNIEIFDRWGNKVFVSKDFTEYWDGRWNRGQVQAGVYTYLIKVNFIDDRGIGETVIKGDVTVIQ